MTNLVFIDRDELKQLREVSNRRKHELLHLHRCCVDNEADAVRYRKMKAKGYNLWSWWDQSGRPTGRALDEALDT